MDKLITYPVIITEHLAWLIYPVAFIGCFLLLALLELGAWVGLHQLCRRLRRKTINNPNEL